MQVSIECIKPEDVSTRDGKRNIFIKVMIQSCEVECKLFLLLHHENEIHTLNMETNLLRKFHLHKRNVVGWFLFVSSFESRVGLVCWWIKKLINPRMVMISSRSNDGNSVAFMPIRVNIFENIKLINVLSLKVNCSLGAWCLLLGFSNTTAIYLNQIWWVR